MKRLVLWFCVGVVLLRLTASSEVGLEFIRPHAIPIRAEAVWFTAKPGQPQRIGALDFVEGWVLSSPDLNFGGLSAMTLHQGRFEIASDIGYFFTLIKGEGGRFAGQIAPMYRGCGNGWLKRHQDVESMAIDRSSGMRWLGMEGKPRLCVVDANGQGKTLRPSLMQVWPETGGAESMAMLRRGGLLILAERDDDFTKPITPAVYFPSLPKASEAVAIPLGYRAPKGYRATDLAELPDGRLLILNRRFEPPFRFTAKLVLVERPALTSGQVLSGREIATLAPPDRVDNMEAMAVEDGPGGPFVWLLSDNNFMYGIEQTLLMKFRLKD